MKLIETTSLNSCQKETMYNLWNNEYPEKLMYRSLHDFEEYLNSLADPYHFLLNNKFDEMVGWAFTYVREMNKWFAIILDGKIQRKGNGTLLLNRLKEKEPVLSAWVIDHHKDIKRNEEPYSSPLSFYQKNDFRICTNIRLETEKISAVKIIWKRTGE
jgi:hypothetical protein